VIPSLDAVLLVLAIAGHYALHLTIYNRLNSLGIPRVTIKRIVKVLFVFTIALPIIFFLTNYQAINDIALGRARFFGETTASIAWGWTVYGIAALAATVWFGIPWLVYRPIIGIHWVKTSRQTEVVDVARIVKNHLPLTTRCHYLSKLPLNQHFELAIERIELPVPGLPDALDGYKIAHFSDVHFTGHIHPDYTAYVVQRASAWRPDLMALTGDIIDHEPCIDWLAGVFAGSEAADGCYYVLGNHDTRVKNPNDTRHAMSAAGWTDLGSRTLDLKLAGVPSRLMGNEYPWFALPDIPEDTSVPADTSKFRLLLSHAPDQIQWARRNNVTLMLAGHTHGGQGRLPIVGPILSPSRYGSRFASGDFYLPPTTMHVTRGLSGTHLMRINCRPELSLLTLRKS
jgi:uncharacterized protein